MKKIAILVLLVLPSIVFSQKLVSGTWIGGKPEIKSITAIARGPDYLGLGEKLAFQFALMGIDSYAQPSFNDNVSIDKENIKSKYAVTFLYHFRVVYGSAVDRIFDCEITLLDIENDGRIIGKFNFKGKAKSDQYASFIVNYMLK